jgi:hypothetical protein
MLEWSMLDPNAHAHPIDRGTDARADKRASCEALPLPEQPKRPRAEASQA